MADGSVFVGSEPGVLHALSLADGTSRWTKEVAAGVGGTPAVGDGRVMVGGKRRRVFAFAPDR